MYCDYFGFTEKPFKPTPEPRFLYSTPQHEEALASILYTIRERMGFVALVGEPGTGKTTLLRAAIHQLDRKTKTAFVFNTNMNFEEILLLVLDDFGLVKPNERPAKIDLVRRLNAFAIRVMSGGGNVAIILDEAHNLTTNAIEGLRLVSNLESEERKLIQIVIAGQTELDRKLAQAKHKQLQQRIVLKRALAQLNEEQSGRYIEHRLAVARYSGPAIFPPRTQKLVYEYSGGVPRLINILCENALLAAYSMNKKTVEPAVIEEVARDFDLVKVAGNGHKRVIPFKNVAEKKGGKEKGKGTTAKGRFSRLMRS
jgi:general secretion pathway protein A